MTSVYDWAPFPHTISVACRDCGGEARFEFAEIVKIKTKADIPIFKTIKGLEYRKFSDYCGHVWHAAVFFRGLLFTSVEGLKSLPEGYEPADFEHPRYFKERFEWPWGVTSCPHCVSARKTELKWPEDAYFKVDFRGEQLWAFNREMFSQIADFLASDHRDEKKIGPPWGGYCRYIPTHFKTAKVRIDIVKKIRDKLAENSDEAF